MAGKRSSALIFIFITVLIDVIGLGVIIPVIPSLISKLAGTDISGAAKYSAWLLPPYALMQFACSPIIGGLSDRFGRRPILLISLLGFGLDYFFQAFAPSIGWLFIGRALAGVTGASFTTASAYIFDVSEPENLVWVLLLARLGALTSLVSLTTIFGPLIMNSLFYYFSQKEKPYYFPGAPYLAGAILMLGSTLFAMYYLKRRLHTVETSPIQYPK